jgi:hypothetical protein
VNNFLNKIRLRSRGAEYLTGEYFKKYTNNQEDDYQPIYEFIEDINEVFRATLGTDIYYIDPLFLEKERQNELIDYLLGLEIEIPMHLHWQDKDKWAVDILLKIFDDMYMIHPDVYYLLVENEHPNMSFNSYEDELGWDGDTELLGSDFWFSKIKYMRSMKLISVYKDNRGEPFRQSYKSLKTLLWIYPRYREAQNKYKKIMFVKKAYYNHVVKTQMPKHRGLCDDVLRLVAEYL